MRVIQSQSCTKTHHPILLYPFQIFLNPSLTQRPPPAILLPRTTMASPSSYPNATQFPLQTSTANGPPPNPVNNHASDIDTPLVVFLGVIVAMMAIYLLLGLLASAARWKLRTLGEEPARLSANPMTMVAVSMVTLKRVKEIMVERRRQRAMLGGQSP